LAVGNQRADTLVAPAWAAPPVDRFAQARCSHDFFHQSAKMLRRQFGLSETDARGIVQSCADCQQLPSSLNPGVNPRGMGPLEIWQMDVTHVTEFGRQKYVHVCIDCFSFAVWVTAQ
ncbi:POK8 protein, partial [Cepphus grylle]|nr:POK8 protein [Cepphus grylle]